MKTRLSAAFLAISLCFSFVLSGHAATATVLVGAAGNTFTPAITNINVGDQVTWKWSGSFHSTTSTNSTWPDTGLQNSGFMFSHTFATGGIYFYYCTQHGTPTSGMKGSIVVVAPNTPPSIAITNPASGTVLPAPANVTVQATASDSDGSVTNVQFLIGSTVLNNQAAAPYFAVTNNLPAGSYTFSAIASDNLGAKNTNTVNVIVDAPPSVALTNPATGTVLSAPANVILKAGAGDTDGTVTNVQFLVGTVVVTNIAAAPFSAATNNLAAGNYTLSAIASDNRGIKSTNSISISVVTPLPLTVNAAQFSSASFQLSFAANAGLSYVIQRSTNLTAPNWIPLLTNTAASNSVVFVDSQATNSPRFYRVGRLPNP